jgi:hypothetical protein
MHDGRHINSRLASSLAHQSLDPKLWHVQFIKVGTGQQPSGFMRYDLSSGHFVIEGIKNSYVDQPCQQDYQKCSRSN